MAADDRDYPTSGRGSGKPRDARAKQAVNHDGSTGRADRIDHQCAPGSVWRLEAEVCVALSCAPARQAAAKVNVFAAIPSGYTTSYD